MLISRNGTDYFSHYNMKDKPAQEGSNSLSLPCLPSLGVRSTSVHPRSWNFLELTVTTVNCGLMITRLECGKYLS